MVTARPMSKPRKFRGFVVLERPDGAVVWGTFRPCENAARAAFERWNPGVFEYPHTVQVVAVEIVLRSAL